MDEKLFAELLESAGETLDSSPEREHQAVPSVGVDLTGHRAPVGS